MTKQQQQKIDKVNKALELMSQGKSIKEVYAEVGYSGADKLKRALKELGYTEVNGHWEKSNTNCNTECTTECNTESNTNCITNKNEVVETKKQELDKSQVIDLLEQEQDTLKSMLEWFKRFSNTENTSNILIKIELPASENVMISTRSNKVVWEEFKKFAKKNSDNFKMGDLVAQALLEYMNKYK